MDSWFPKRLGSPASPRGRSDADPSRRREQRTALRTRLRDSPEDPASASRLPDLLTPAEVAAWLKTTIPAIYAKAERGTLPGATRIGRRLYFLRADLLRLVEQGRVPRLGDPGDDT